MESTSRSNNKMLSNEKVSTNHEQAFFFLYDNDYDSSQLRLKLASRSANREKKRKIYLYLNFPYKIISLIK